MRQIKFKKKEEKKTLFYFYFFAFFSVTWKSKIGSVPKKLKGLAGLGLPEYVTEVSVQWSGMTYPADHHLISV